MKKSTLKIAAVLSGLAVCLTAFAACSSEDNESKLIYKEGGKIYYRPSEGEAAYELATDDNGVTRVDEEGNLLWKVTDVNGEDQTHPVSFPAFINDGKEVSCQQFSITLTRGWENTGNGMIMLRNEKDNAKIDYTFFEMEEGDETVPTAEARVEMLQNLLKPSVDDGSATMKVTDVQVAGKDAKKVELRTTGKANAYLEVYFVSLSNGVMSFSCACDFEDAGKYDFKAILDTIEYRV